MNYFKISKFNPAYKDSKGNYTKMDEWISFNEIGCKFNNSIFTADEYFQTETKYINTILSIIDLLNLDKFQIINLEHRLYNNNLSKITENIFIESYTKYSKYYSETMKQLFYNIKERDYLNKKQFTETLELVFRNHLWCKFIASSKFVLDYLGSFYILVGVDMNNAEIQNLANKNGLYVEIES